ncbi:MAG: hypothetical protein PHS82_13110 [Lachnospiraceae bacterium]|nr:hypothetical protein [Lachnospiraceae bacterium]
MEKKKSELFGVISRILVYVIVMSLFESIYADHSGQAWRVIPAAIILGLLLAGMARSNDFSALGFTSHTPLP